MTARQQLQALQFNQLDHDKLFHPDILCLPTQRRINHMVLHFAKYSGQFALAKQNQDRELLISKVIDTFVICLVTANIFSKNISDMPHISCFADKVSIHELAKHLSHASNTTEGHIYSYVSEGVAIEAGRMSKAIESLDHLESYPYTDELTKSLANIIDIVLVGAFYLNINLIDATKNRLDKVEKKSIFYKMHRHNVIEDSKSYR